MENFKPKLEVKGVSKAIKLLTLLIGMGAAENSLAQEKVSSLEQLIQDAKKYEMSISDKAKEKGQIGNMNLNPFATIGDESKISEIIYSDSQRQKIANVLVGSNNFYYLDSNGDGEIDAVYIDKDKTPKEIGEGVMDARMSMEGEITRAELVTSDMMGEFVCFKLNEQKVYDSSDDTVADISKKEDQDMVKMKLQEKFNKTLKDNLESIK
jgi:hypothetical protein